MTKLDLAHLAEVAGKATPDNVWNGDGWEAHRWEDGGGEGWHIMVCGVGNWPIANVFAENDARYIEAARPSVVLALLDRLREAEGALRPFGDAYLAHKGEHDPVDLRFEEEFKAAASYFTPQPPALLGRGEG